MIQSSRNFSQIWKEEEAFLRPVLRAGRDNKIVMGMASRGLQKKLNRSVRFSDKARVKRIVQKADFRRGNVFDYHKGYGQRVVVKSHVVKHVGRAENAKTLRSHSYYLTREGAGADGEKPVFYSVENEVVDANHFINAAKADPHHFRIIISPENGSDIEDMEAYIRDVMKGVNEDLGIECDWIAVNHCNTDNPHAHVIIRGRDRSGRELKISRDYISFGMRERAQEVANLYLGERSLLDIREARKGEVRAPRVTSLDHKIEALAGKGRRVDVRLGSRVGNSLFEESLIRGRLVYLKEAGLVIEKEMGVFEVKEGFKDVLSDMAKRGDIIKQMYDRIGKDTARMIYVDLRKSEGEEIAGLVMDKGPVDELLDRNYVIVKDRLGRPHYINIGANRAYDEIEKGSIIKVNVAQASTGKADRNIAALAAQNDGIYNLYKHYDYVDEHMRFIPEEDRQVYVDRHLLRLESLEKKEAVTRISEIEFKVPADLVEQGEKITEEINERLRRYGVADVKLVCAVPLEKQVEAEAWTDLDEALLNRSQGKISSLSGWKEVEAALEKRTIFLKENGYAKEIEGKLHISSASKPTLQQKELKVATSKLERKFARTYKPAEELKTFNAVYRGRVKLHSGTYAVMTYGHQGFTIVPVAGAIRAKVGQEVSVTHTKKGTFRIRGLEMGLSL